MRPSDGEFPIAEKYCYFNTAGVGLIPATVVREIQEAYGRYLTTPPYDEMFRELREGVEGARREFAPLINARPDEISFLGNSSTGVNFAVEMVDAQRGQNLVADDLGFPSDVYPLLALKRKGVSTRIVKNRRGVVEAKDYARAIDERTRLVVLSYVSWVNGLRLGDLKEIVKVAKEKGAFVLVDTTHATGYLDIDVKDWGVDFLVTSNYKWLLSPVGAAEFYCPRPIRREFAPPHVGWNSAAGGTRGLKVEGFKLANSGRRFEAGNPDYIAILGLTRSLSFLSKVGHERIRKRTLELAGEVLEGLDRCGMEVLSPRDDGHRSAVLFARSKVRSGLEIARALAKRAVLVSDRYYHGTAGIRISPYFYNDSEQVAALIDGLREVLA